MIYSKLKSLIQRHSKSRIKRMERGLWHAVFIRQIGGMIAGLKFNQENNAIDALRKKTLSTSYVLKH